jgi:hypothetical protein
MIRIAKVGSGAGNGVELGCRTGARRAEARTRGQPRFRMHSASKLFGFGKSATLETLGYNHPDKFPLRNGNTNAGPRFLGHKVKN